MVAIGIKLTLVGSLCILFGLWGTVDGLTGGVFEDAIGGLRWKGPLLLVAGAASAFMGIRMIREALAEESKKKAAGEAAAEIAQNAMNLFK